MLLEYKVGQVITSGAVVMGSLEPLGKHVYIRTTIRCYTSNSLAPE